NRKRLAHVLGVRDERARSMSEWPSGWVYGPALDPDHPKRGTIHPVIWRAFRDVTGEGLMIDASRESRLSPVIIVVPDADRTREQLAGLTPGVAAESQVARRLADSGFRVIIPALIDRTIEPRNGRARITNREFVYRSAFELGRHIIGYEVQKVLA